MKKQYDFSKGKRGRIQPATPEPQGKTRITIRIDEDLVDYFLKEADRSGGATGYQTLINNALRQHMEGKAPKIEDSLRRIVREEIRRDVFVESRPDSGQFREKNRNTFERLEDAVNRNRSEKQDARDRVHRRRSTP